MRLESRSTTPLYLLLILAVVFLTGPVSADLLCGDCNSDGVIDAKDADFAALLAATPSLRTGARAAKCDVDGDNDITILDALQIANPPVGGFRCFECQDCDGMGGFDATTDCARIQDIADGAVNPPSSLTPLFAVCDLDGNGAIEDADANLCPNGACGRCGDCNHDGNIDIVDALVAAQHAAGQITLAPGCQFNVCDVNGSGAIDITDALSIAQHSAGLITLGPCP